MIFSPKNGSLMSHSHLRLFRNLLKHGSIVAGVITTLQTGKVNKFDLLVYTCSCMSMGKFAM